MCSYWAVDTQLWANKDWLFGVYLLQTKQKKKKNAPWRANFREPRSTALYPNPRYNEVRYNEGRLYMERGVKLQTKTAAYYYRWLDYSGDH